MNKKFAIVLALALIAIVCCAGCIDPQDPVDPVYPVDPVDPVDPITPVDPVVPAEEYSVFFMMNYGDAGAYTAETVKAGDAVSKPANPSRSGYNFKGWFTAAEGGAAYDFTQAVNADLTLYAQWSKKSSSGSGSSHTHNYATGGQKGDQYGLFCSCGAFKPTGSVDNAIDQAPAGATITLVEDTQSESTPIVISKDKDVIIDGAGKTATLQYEDVESIQIKKEGSDNLIVEVPYDKDEDGIDDGTKTVIFEEVEGKDLLVPAAAVDDENNVGDAYTASGLLEIFEQAGMLEDEGATVLNAPVEDAPSEHVQDGWTVLFYEPAPAALGDEPEAEKPWTITLQDNINLKDVEWIPIGTKEKPFTGTFDGNGKTISNLKVTGENYVGFFGYVKGDATKLKTSISEVYNTEFISPDEDTYTTKIGNFKLEGVDVSATGSPDTSVYACVAAAVGAAEYAYVHDITVNGKVSSTIVGDGVGGIVGGGFGSLVEKCTNNAEITGSGGWNVGGISGIMWPKRYGTDAVPCVSIISECTNGGSLTYTLGAGGAGGICGQTGIGSFDNNIGLVIYNSVNNGDITISTQKDDPTYNRGGSASGILGMANPDTPIIIAKCQNGQENDPVKISTAESSKTVYSLNGIYDYAQKVKVIDCKVFSILSGNALGIGGVASNVEGASISGTTINTEITNTYQSGVTSTYIAEAGNSVIKDITFTEEEFNAALPVSEIITFENVIISSDTESVDIVLKEVPGTAKKSLTLDISKLSNKEFSLDISNLRKDVSATVIFPESAKVTITSTVTVNGKLTLKGTGIQVTNNVDIDTIEIKDASGAIFTNSKDKTIGEIAVYSNGVEIYNEGAIGKLSIQPEFSNVVIKNAGAIGSETTEEYVIYLHEFVDGVVIHNMNDGKLVGGKNAQYTIYSTKQDGFVFLNYVGAEVNHMSTTNAEPFANVMKVFAFDGGIKHSDNSHYSFTGKNHAFNASKIEMISAVYTGGSPFNKDNVKVYTNFTADSGYDDMELPHSWLVFGEEEDNEVEVTFLGKFTDTIDLTANEEEAQSE